MRTLCSLDTILWDFTPKHTTLAGIPLIVHKMILNYMFEVDVAPLLDNHCCDTSAPCILARKAMQTSLPWLLVCKFWNGVVSSKWAIHSSMNESITLHGSDSLNIAHGFSLDGRYRRDGCPDATLNKGVFSAYDYGGLTGCHGRVEVVIKVTNVCARHENEKDVYSRMDTQEASKRLVPHLLFQGMHVGAGEFHGLVLTKLGPDLEQLRIDARKNCFTPRQTLSVAIQTVIFFRGEVPDYDRIVKRFLEPWERKGYNGSPWTIDWWEELGLRGRKTG
ncbi:hypothetical protein K439DRAFT_1641828 [Ramaria rubella]|nr:hypothetical protein K439DRAFT_1641828 [Ramaria rubella]